MGNNRDKVITTEGVIWKNVKEDNNAPIDIPKFKLQYVEFVAQEPLLKCSANRINKEKCYLKGDKVQVVGPTNKENALIFTRTGHYKKPTSELPINTAVPKIIELDIKGVGFCKDKNGEEMKCYKVSFNNCDIWLEKGYMESCVRPIIVIPPSPQYNRTTSPGRPQMQDRNTNGMVNAHKFKNEMLPPPPPIPGFEISSSQTRNEEEEEEEEKEEEEEEEEKKEEVRGEVKINGLNGLNGLNGFEAQQFQQFQPQQETPVGFQEGKEVICEGTPFQLAAARPADNGGQYIYPQGWQTGPTFYANPCNPQLAPVEQFVYHNQQRLMYLMQSGPELRCCYCLPDNWESFVYGLPPPPPGPFNGTP